ncbi:MAG: hypothetical protein EOO61_04190 [Hymenobacter sp.]|nr:MAG: hypothetical protein EOO61_04190 [Hymenobacter sp.]
MPKWLLAFCLLTALISSSFSRFFALAAFEANQKYIAENLCVNKSRPWLHCNGHCYFIKKVHQAEENEKKEAARNNLSRTEVSFFQEPLQFAFIMPVDLTAGIGSFLLYTYQYSNHHLDAIFKPPRQATA